MLNNNVSVLLNMCGDNNKTGMFECLTTPIQNTKCLLMLLLYVSYTRLIVQMYNDPLNDHIFIIL